MPTPRPPESENSLLGKDRLTNLLELLETAKKTVEGVRTSFMNQVLENSDQIVEAVKKNGKTEINSLAENMLKAPIRKHCNRLETATKGLDEVIRQIETAAQTT